MARKVQVIAFDGKQGTQEESLITYQVGIPNDVTFYTRDNVIYCQFWDNNAGIPNLISIPAFQLVSIQ